LPGILIWIIHNQVKSGILRLIIQTPKFPAEPPCFLAEANPAIDDLRRRFTKGIDEKE
jgi:hypothetical protein